MATETVPVIHNDPPVNGTLISPEIATTTIQEGKSNHPFLITHVVASEEEQQSEKIKYLQIGDFDLLRTLGTGTFARVWLVKPKDKNKVAPGKKNLVYALKILRKADGEC